ncbi:MAG TPA: restriction endonuclease [Thermomonospora sp.]|nr:restriction endonuclease [Thermomonospora sp.]
MARSARRRRSRKSDSLSFPQLALLSLGGGVLAGMTLLSRAATEHPAATVAVLVVLLGAAVAASVAYQRHTARRRRALFEANCHLERIDLMTGAQFEHHVAELLRRDGFRAVQVVGRTADRGVDVTARAPDGALVAVQCKRWKNNVGAQEVRNFIGALGATYRGHRGVFIASSLFTAQAREEASLAAVHLIDRPHLGRWLTGEPLSLP